ncbi:MAG: carboxypeptidase-like regulatory domain-containing protein [Bryobacteraceae bacterium]|nr:carboxypeptidase-like regulatory domain-containing protein [Bryobacteraceae bacterium]
MLRCCAKLLRPFHRARYRPARQRHRGCHSKGDSVRTGIAAQTQTNGEGLYELPNLLPGTYILNADFPGFRQHARSGVVLRVGDIVELNVPLEVGAASDSVSVTAEAPMLETSTASLGQVVDTRMITEMPLAGRDVNYLMQLTPGVVSTNAPMHG